MVRATASPSPAPRHRIGRSRRTLPKASRRTFAGLSKAPQTRPWHERVFRRHESRRCGERKGGNRAKSTHTGGENNTERERKRESKHTQRERQRTGGRVGTEKGPIRKCLDADCCRYKSYALALLHNESYSSALPSVPDSKTPVLYRMVHPRHDSCYIDPSTTEPTFPTKPPQTGPGRCPSRTAPSKRRLRLLPKPHLDRLFTRSLKKGTGQFGIHPRSRARVSEPLVDGRTVGAARKRSSVQPKPDL